MQTITRRALAALAWAAAGLALAGMAQAQDYPTRPIKWIVPYLAGTAPDITVRIAAEAMSETLRQPVVVENKGGASGIIGTQSVVRAKPDGYTVLLINLASQVAVGAQQDVAPYDPLADFNPVALVATYRNVLLSNRSVPGETVAEFIASAKKLPRGIAFGSGGIGSLNQMAVEILMRDTGVEIVHVPYQSGGEAVLALNSNQIQLYFTDVNSALSARQMGNARLLAQTGDARSPLMPDVPLMGEQGIAQLSKSRAIGLTAPPGTPNEIVDKLHAAVVKALESPEMQSRAAAIGIDLAPAPRQAFREFIEADVATWVPIAKELKARDSK